MSILTLADVIVDPVEIVADRMTDPAYIAIGITVVAVIAVAITLIVRKTKRK